MVHWSRKAVPFAIAVVGLAALASCSSDQPASAPTDSVTPSASESVTAPPTNGVPVSFKATLTSIYKKVESVGPKDSQTFGVNVLSGTTKINDRTVTVRILGTVDYDKGNGPFGGFMELVWSDGTTIGMRQEGKASVDPDTKKTEFSARLDVIAGTKAAVATDGTGEWTGSKSGSTGTSMSISVNLMLTGAPEALTGVPPNSTPTPSTSYNATIAP